MLCKKQLSVFLLLALLCLLLAGCAGEEPPPAVLTLSFGEVPLDSQELTAVLTPEDIPLLDELTELRAADFSGSACFEELAAWGRKHPEVKLRFTVPFPDGSELSNSVSLLDFTSYGEDQIEAALPLLKFLPEMKRVRLGSGRTPELAAKCISSYPEIDFLYELSLFGQKLSKSSQELDLREAGHQDAELILRYLPLLPSLQTVELGSDEANGHFEWEDIYAMQAACPQAEFNYSFKLYGKSFTLADELMDFRRTTMKDEGALVLSAARCMPHLKKLDMDHCGVSDESMAAIRDALPEVNVVWRIWFGRNYTVRTDVEKILASNPGIGGELTPENAYSLRYCTKVKYLDLGHNSYLGSIEFASYMPDLEVLIIALSNVSDLSPLANCPKLEYLEILTTAVNDLRPLSGLKNLRHINVCYALALHDITPLYELEDLDRLWLGCLTPVPQEQVDKLLEIFPDCEVNTTTLSPLAEGWRYLSIATPTQSAQLAERYRLLRQQFDYREYSYAYPWNDPLY